LNLSVEDLPANGTAAMDRLEKGFKRGLEVKRALRLTRQLSVGQSVKALGLGTRHVDGLGELRGFIDAHHYFAMREEDPDYWEDPQNRLNYYKKHPDSKISNWTGGSRTKHIGCSMKEINDPKFDIERPA